MSPYLTRPTRTLREIRTDLADRRLALWLAYGKGEISEPECDRQLEPIERRLEMIERAEAGI